MKKLGATRKPDGFEAATDAFNAHVKECPTCAASRDRWELCAEGKDLHGDVLVAFRKGQA